MLQKTSHGSKTDIKFLIIIFSLWLCKDSFSKERSIYCLPLSSNQPIETVSTNSETIEGWKPGNLGPEYFFWRHNLSKLNTLQPNYSLLKFMTENAQVSREYDILSILLGLYIPLSYIRMMFSNSWNVLVPEGKSCFPFCLFLPFKIK